MKSTDAELRRWWSRHRTELEKIANDASSPESEALIQKLALSCVRDRGRDGASVVVGGLVDNTVVFEYSPADLPPLISSDEYSWVEPLGGHWYLVKTT